MFEILNTFHLLRSVIGWQNSRHFSTNENQNQNNRDLHPRIFPRMRITVATDQRNFSTLN